MRRLLKNGTVINVFTGELEKSNVLIEDGRIIGLGEYGEADADETADVTGMYICPGFIDAHILRNLPARQFRTERRQWSRIHMRLPMCVDRQESVTCWRRVRGFR